MPVPLFQSVVSWLTATMIAAAPLSRFSPGRVNQSAVESAEDATARYGDLAEAVARVAYDPDEPPLFAGPHGRAKTALLLLSVAYHESGFRRDVGTGELRGDHGRSCSYFQFNIGTGTNLAGHTCDDLLASHEVAARDALKLVRVAMRTCIRLSVPNRLSMYVSGRCVPHRQAKARYTTAMRWFSIASVPGHDEMVMRSRPEPFLD